MCPNVSTRPVIAGTITCRNTIVQCQCNACQCERPNVDTYSVFHRRTPFWRAAPCIGADWRINMFDIIDIEFTIDVDIEYATLAEYGYDDDGQT